MSDPTFDQLLSVPTQETVLNQEVFPELKSRKVRITDWLTNGVYSVMANVVAKLRVNVRLAIAIFVAACFEDYAFGNLTPPANEDGSVNDVTGYAPIIALQRYGTKRIEATYTVRNITLTNSVASSYGPIQPGDFKIRFPSGNRYVNRDVLTIPPSGVIVVPFRSELPTDSQVGRVYNDPTDSVITLVTSSYPGVTAANPSTTYSIVAQTGSGLGTVTPSGSPSGSHAVAIRIDSTGNVADPIAWSSQVDTLGWVAHTGSAASNLGGVGINVTLSDNGGNPAFISGEVYYFNTPGSDIIQVGADTETPQQLGARCRGLIPALAFSKDDAGNWVPGSPVKDAYTTLILNANLQVRTVFIKKGSVNNAFTVVVAGQGGVPLPSGVVANVQAFFNAFNFLTDRGTVVTSTSRAITLAGLTLACRSGQLSAAQTELTRRLQVYLGSADSKAELGINGFVDYEYIIALARTTPGVTRVSGTLLINGVATDLQLPVAPGAFESALWSQSSTTAFSWAPT